MCDKLDLFSQKLAHFWEHSHRYCFLYAFLFSNSETVRRETDGLTDGRMTKPVIRSIISFSLFAQVQKNKDGLIIIPHGKISHDRIQ